MPDIAPSRWRRLGWLSGLPLLGLVWVAANLVGAPYLDARLRSAAAVVIRESGDVGSEPWLRVEVHGRDLVALGEASDATRRTAALERLALIPGKRRVVDRTGVIEQASPFVWTATWTGPSTIELAGSRPAEIGGSALAARLSSALPPDTALIDHTRAARGASPAFIDGAVFAVERLRGLKPAAVATVSDTVLSFEGEAANAQAYDGLRTGLVPPPGFTLGRVAIVAPLVDDFRFGIERRPDGTVVLTGNVVSEAARADLRAGVAAAIPGAAVSDTMQTARGLRAAVEPNAFGQFAVSLAALVQEGSVSYSRETLTVLGVAIDRQAIGEIEDRMRSRRPSGVSAGTVTLTARPVSPYRVRILREADTVSLSGHLPDTAARDELLATVRARFFQETMVDNTRLSDGAPDRLMPVLKTAVGTLATLASGSVEVLDHNVRYAGWSLYAESAKRLRATLPTGAPPGWSVQAEIALKDDVPRYDALVCARRFAESITAHPIRFTAGSSELTPGFYLVLDAIAELAKHCPDGRVEVAGHIDPPGSAKPQATPLPEYTASIKPAKEKPKPAKAGKEGAPAAKASGTKTSSADATASTAPTSTPPAPTPEALPDLAQQRALAIVDYLTKAGLEPSRVVTASGQPLSSQQGIGLALRQ